MKKLLLLTLAIVTLTSLGYSQRHPAKKNGWETDNLRGKVKSIIRESYTQDSIGGLVISQQEVVEYDELGRHTYKSYWFGSYYYKYDDMGRIIEKNYYEGDSSISNTSWLANWMERETFDFYAIPTDQYQYTLGNRFAANVSPSEGEVPSNKTYKYDDEGNLIERNSYNADGSLSRKETYKYDDEGNRFEANSIQSRDTNVFEEIAGTSYKASDATQGDMTSEVVVKYDDEGNLIEGVDFPSVDGFLFVSNTEPSFSPSTTLKPSKETYKYDDKGNLIEWYYYELHDGLAATYKYDAKGNLIEEISYSHAGVGNTTYKYDAKGNKIEENSYFIGLLDRKYTMKYDAKGNLIEGNSYEADGSLDYKYTFKYEFDEKGNWIKIISFRNQIPESIEEREFEYYE